MKQPEENRLAPRNPRATAIQPEEMLENPYKITNKALIQAQHNIVFYYKSMEISSRAITAAALFKMIQAVKG